MEPPCRCGWVDLAKPYYVAYHDQEWGVPVHDDGRHFEFLILEGAQAGLSWDTILRKREGFRQAFAGFDPAVVARFGAAEVEALRQNPAIVRNRLKIESASRNARVFLAIQERFGSFDAYVWDFVDGKPRINTWKNWQEIPASTPQSDALSKDLIKRGMNFVGTTIIYAHMQATGLVMDHTLDCFRYAQLS
ncbi:MAG: DNA-3-methyladenine glycosylase I [Magnetococcales bacterium]|nr:DNA-3-methyladenine glycosylase I [Magnetococcales bacterium]